MNSTSETLPAKVVGAIRVGGRAQVSIGDLAIDVADMAERDLFQFQTRRAAAMG